MQGGIQTPSPPAAPISAQQLAGIPNITANEVQVLQGLTAGAWTRLQQYAATNRNPFSVKGKIAEEVYLGGTALAVVEHELIALVVLT